MVRQAVVRRARQLGVIVAVWTTLAICDASQWYLGALHSGHPVAGAYVLRFAFTVHWIFAALTPFVLWVSTRFPFRRRGWPTTAAVHALAFTLFLLIFVSLRMILVPIYDPATGKLSHGFRALFPTLLLNNAYDAFWMYGVIVAVSELWRYYRKYRERELRASKLEAQLAQAQLKMLKMQLEPHFLFNTLHLISSLMHEDVEAADNMVARLSDLLRMSLENVNEQEVTLKREMEFLEGYLEIQQTRFRDRLKVRLSIDPRSLDALVPNMILQPLVENAVRHGIASRSGPGRVEIRSELQNGTLHLEVRDDGPGLEESRSDTPPPGLGLTNTRARLQQLYGESHRFSLRKPDQGGALATLDIPLRLKSDRAGEESFGADPNHHRG